MCGTQHTIVVSPDNERHVAERGALVQDLHALRAVWSVRIDMVIFAPAKAAQAPERLFHIRHCEEWPQHKAMIYQ